MHIIFYIELGDLIRKSKILSLFNLASSLFQSKFVQKPNHKCPTDFNASDCSVLPFKFNKSKHRISVRSPILWKSIPTNLDRKNTGKCNHFIKKELM